MPFLSAMKHTHTSHALSVAQQRAKTLCISDEVIDWHNKTFCGIAFDVFPLDFRSKEGRAVRSKCRHVSDTAKLKRFTLALAKVAIQQKDTSVIPSKSTGPPAPTAIDWSTVSQDVVRRLHYTILRWWHQHSRRQKGPACLVPSLWKNDVDPVSQEQLHNDLPFVFLFTYIDSQRCCFAFDVRSLHMMFQTDILTNPFTQQPFPESVKQSVKDRVLRLGGLGYSMVVEDDQSKAKLSVDEKNHARILEITQAWDGMGYHITVEMMEALTPAQQVLWYARCEDTWSYRAQLSASAKARIVPHGTVFPMKSTIKSYLGRTSHLTKHVLNAMHKLVTRGVTAADRVTGSMYVLGALTECSAVFREAYPMLYQPPYDDQHPPPA